MNLLQKTVMDLAYNTKTKEGTLTITKPYKVLEIDVDLLNKLLAVVDAAKSIQPYADLSFDPDIALAEALAELEKDI